MRILDLTKREKDLLIEILSQLTFKVGQSDLAREYENLMVKLQQPAVTQAPAAQAVEQPAIDASANTTE